ncbi:MAG: ATP-binding protein, partial [Pseudomonadota bacterium]
ISDNHKLQIFVPVVNKNNDVQFVIKLIYDTKLTNADIFLLRIIFTIITAGFVVILFFITFIMSRKYENLLVIEQDENLQLKLAKQEAEQMSYNKTKFLANVSHELRTPLNAIIGFSDLIKQQAMGPLNNDKYMEYIVDINNSGNHLLSLISDILDYSKAEANKLDFELIKIDLNKILVASCRLVLPRAKEAKIDLLFERPTENIVIKADPKRIKQVMINLLSNSVKFTPEDGFIKLQIDKDYENNNVHIIVEDNGIGISAKNIAQAMSTFGQVDSNLSRRYEGTGLGLPFSKKLTELMGGTFQIKSEENLGTIITITFPMVQLDNVNFNKTDESSPKEPDDQSN